MQGWAVLALRGFLEMLDFRCRRFCIAIGSFFVHSRYAIGPLGGPFEPCFDCLLGVISCNISKSLGFVEKVQKPQGVRLDVLHALKRCFEMTIAVFVVHSACCTSSRTVMYSRHCPHWYMSALASVCACARARVFCATVCVK